MLRMISCPCCSKPFNWSAQQSCPDGHKVAAIGEIPLCFDPSIAVSKTTADPYYPLDHACAIARDIESTAGSFLEGLDRFFQIRSAELRADLAREKQLITRRIVGDVNECIADASLLLARINKPFPVAHRCHLDIGCGLGFGLAASSRSYFGANVVGIDLSPHYLVLARRLLAEHGVDNAMLYCADICDGWPFPLDHYDVAFISMEGVLEHIKNIPAFFGKLRQLKTFPTVIYLTVPYRWTLRPESHFNLRFITWLPQIMQDRYIAWRLGVPAIDHVEFFSMRTLRRTLERFFVPESIVIARNSDHPLTWHYLRGLIYIEGPQSLV